MNTRTAIDFGASLIQEGAAREKQTQLTIPDDPFDFCRECVFTQDEHAKAKGLEYIRPLLADGDDYLRIIAEAVSTEPMLRIEKSRQLRVTWLLAALMVHKSLTQPGCKIAYQSKTYDHGDAYLRDRFWFIYTQIPAKYKVPKARYVSGVIEVFHDEASTIPTSQIMVLAEGAEAVRQYTFTTWWSDEFAFQQWQDEALTAARPTLTGGGQAILTSSANGNQNLFYRLGHEDIAPGVYEPSQDVGTGVSRWRRNGWTTLRVHYTADQSKRGTWAEQAKAGTPTSDWNKEQEISFDVQPGMPVFVDTDRVVVKRQEVRGHCPWLTGWDFGFQWPFCFVVQIEAVDGDPKNLMVHVLHEFVRPNTEIYEFGNWVKAEREKMFGTDRKWHDFGDDASKQQTDKGVTAQILQRLGITIRSQPTGPGGILKRCTLFQRLISGGAVEIDPQCKYLITAIKSGYVRDEDGNPIGGTEGHPYADACFPATVGVNTEHGPRSIALVRIGERVWTRRGLRKVTAAGYTGVRRMWKIETRGGRTLHGTGNHRVITNRGKVSIDALLYGDILTTATQKQGEIAGKTILRGRANVAGESSHETNTKECDSAQNVVLRVTRLDVVVPVFNLTVEDEHEYFANGILVSNCDALLYCLVNTMDIEFQPTGRKRLIEGTPLAVPPGQPQPAQKIDTSHLTRSYVPGNSHRVVEGTYTKNSFTPTRHDPKKAVRR